MLQMIRHNHRKDQLAVRNRKLAVALGILAASIYGGYILTYYFL